MQGISKTKGESGKRYSPPAVEQASQILFALAGASSAQLSLADISGQVGISGSKAFGILTALEKSGIVKRGKDGKGYSLGTGLIALSRKVLDDLVPSQLAEPFLETLTAESGSTSVFGLVSGDCVYVVAKRESGGDVRLVMRVGYVMPLTYGAHGKAIVPFLPEVERGRIMKREDLHFHGDPDKLDRALLANEMAQCRREGFACAVAQAAPGVTVVCAPVFGITGVPIGFIEICALAPEDIARQFGPLVAKAGRDLSRQFGGRVIG